MGPRTPIFVQSSGTSGSPNTNSSGTACAMVHSSSRAAQHDDAPPLNLAKPIDEDGFLSGIGDVGRAVRERVDSEMPASPGVRRYFEIKRFPEHVHHDVQVLAVAEAGDRARQGAGRRITESRAVQLRPVPRDVSQAALVRLATIEVRLPERRVRLPERNHALEI